MENDLLKILTREGVLLNVSVRYWRGCKKLKAEDIGLDPDKISNKLISLGHKRLLPKEATAALGLIESRTHALVEANTFPFLNGLAHFLPNTKLEEVLGKLKELEREFWNQKRDFIRRYGKLREQASVDWRAMAEKLVEQPERLVATIEGSFPIADRMDRLFGFDIQQFQIAVPERLGMDMLSLGDQQNLMAARQQAARDASRKIRQDVEVFVSGCVSALREQTAQLCSDMLQSISTAETGVHQKTLNRLIRFIDQFKQLNFANDTDMEQQLEAVRKELLTRTAEQYRDSASSREQLVNGLTRLRNHANQLAKAEPKEIVQRFGELG
ncbi:MAG: hypothetical protein JWM68_689, partial [Verrucomicrobiales bacterium]|nr:hypothetical protein [Verrucomicrobiales bacterium]